MGPHPEQELLVALAGPVDAHVRCRRRGQEAAEGVEGLGADGHPVDALGLGRVARELPLEERAKLREPDPVDVEATVERRDVALAQRPGELGRDVVAIGSLRLVVVGNVARRLLEIGHETAPLEDLGQEVRGALARQVHAAELSHRVVAVLDEHALVELLGPSRAGVGVRRAAARGRREAAGAEEFVDEEAAERLRRARIAREQRAFHDLGQVDEREDGAVEVGDVRRESGPLLRGELFGHPRPMVSDRPAPRGMPGGAGRHETRYAIATELPGDPVAPLMGTGLNDQANSYALSARSPLSSITSVSSWNRASCSTPPGITPRSPGPHTRFSLPSPSRWAWAGLLLRQMAHDVVARARP